MKVEVINEVCSTLTTEYGNSRECFLNYTQPYELMVAAILSAQCTDIKVNLVTPTLFKRYPSLESFAQAEIPELQSIIHPCGLSERKAHFIRSACSELQRRYAGEIPNDLVKLEALTGVGSKTANLLRMELYDEPSVVVDTHVHRICNRLGLASGSVVAVEHAIRKLVPLEQWNFFTRQLIKHGRAVCDAKYPACDRCCLNVLCEKKV